ncbi:MAG: sugar ABC transporter substrate-binding protein [Vicinamibacterales bacterium]
MSSGELAVSRRGFLQWAMAAGVVLAGAPAVSACAGRFSDATHGQVTMANVSNPVTQDLQQLAPKFLPDVDVRFSALPETQLREKVAKDIAAGTGQFDVIAVGPYEAVQYAESGWLADLKPLMEQDSNYDAGDLIPTVIQTLSKDAGVYAIPVYAESAFLMYRTDLFEQAGLSMPAAPTWQEVAALAQQLKSTDIAGICLRGLAGENQVPLMATIYTFGGRVFTPEWEPTFTEPETREAIAFYVDLARSAGQPGIASAGFTQCLATMSQGNAAMWMDATVAANTLEDPDQSKVSGKVGYVPAPRYRSPFGGWYWSWALAIPKASKNREAAWEFVKWATSREYIRQVADELGVEHTPPGTRMSTYENPTYLEAAPYARTTLTQIQQVGPEAVLKPSAPPDLPAAYFSFPQWGDVYTPLSQEIAAAIAGNQTADEAIAKIQSTTTETMKRIGLYRG